MSHDRFVSNAILDLHEANCGPIFGYQHLSIPTIDKAIEKLIPFVPGIEDYVSKAKEVCNRHSNISTTNKLEIRNEAHKYAGVLCALKRISENGSALSSVIHSANSVSLTAPLYKTYVFKS